MGPGTDAKKNHRLGSMTYGQSGVHTSMPEQPPSLTPRTDKHEYTVLAWQAIGAHVGDPPQERRT